MTSQLIKHPFNDSQLVLLSFAIGLVEYHNCLFEPGEGGGVSQEFFCFHVVDIPDCRKLFLDIILVSFVDVTVATLPFEGPTDYHSLGVRVVNVPDNFVFPLFRHVLNHFQTHGPVVGH